MAEWGRGGSGPIEDVRNDEKEHQQAEEGCGASQPSVTPPEGEREIDGSSEDALWSKHITTRKSGIDPEAKRKEYLEKLELMTEELHNMRSDPEKLEPLQLKAIDVTVRVVRMCYNIVRDVDIEMIEDELEQIEEEIEEAKKEVEESEDLDFAPLDDLTGPPGSG